MYMLENNNIDIIKDLIKEEKETIFVKDIIIYRVPFYYTFILSLSSDNSKKRELLVDVRNNIVSYDKYKNSKFLWIDLDYFTIESFYPTVVNENTINKFPDLDVNQSIIILDKNTYALNISKKIKNIIHITPLIIDLIINDLIFKFNFNFLILPYPIDYITAYIYYNIKIDKNVFFITDKYHPIFKDLNKFKITKNNNEILNYILKEVTNDK